MEAARDHAERVRRDSERELAAVTAQRDAISAQLGNVRTMLATVGGGSLLGGSLMAAAFDDPAQVDRPQVEVMADAEREGGEHEEREAEVPPLEDLAPRTNEDAEVGEGPDRTA